jgi:copper chaperone CopZ
MKYLILSTLMMLGLSVFAAGKTLVVGVKGMHCKSCAESLTKDLSAMAEVEKCDVNLKKKQAMVTLKDGATLDKAKISKVIEDAGYTMTTVVEKK